jgi:hypothetical protein
VQELGVIEDKPVYKQVPAHNLAKLAAYGTGALFAAWDLDEFLVLPGGQSRLQQLLAPGGCLSTATSKAQALIRSKV